MISLDEEEYWKRRAERAEAERDELLVHVGQQAVVRDDLSKALEEARGLLARLEDSDDLFGQDLADVRAFLARAGPAPSGEGT